jgi:hypothetical protein
MRHVKKDNKEGEARTQDEIGAPSVDLRLRISRQL